jgi:hypothetical protein
MPGCLIKPAYSAPKTRSRVCNRPCNCPGHSPALADRCSRDRVAAAPRVDPGGSRSAPPPGEPPPTRPAGWLRCCRPRRCPHRRCWCRDWPGRRRRCPRRLPPRQPGQCWPLGAECGCWKWGRGGQQRRAPRRLPRQTRRQGRDQCPAVCAPPCSAVGVSEVCKSNYVATGRGGLGKQSSPVHAQKAAAAAVGSPKGGIPSAHLTRLLTESVLILNMGMPADLVAVLIQLPAGSKGKSGAEVVGKGGWRRRQRGREGAYILTCLPIQPLARSPALCGSFDRPFLHARERSGWHHTTKPCCLSACDKCRPWCRSPQLDALGGMHQP